MAASPVTEGRKQVALGETGWLLILFDEAERREGGIRLCYDVSGTSGSLVLQIGFEQQAQPDVSKCIETWCSQRGLCASRQLLTACWQEHTRTLGCLCQCRAFLARGCVVRRGTAAWWGPSPGPPADMPHVGLFPAHWGILAFWLQVTGTHSPVLPAPSALHHHRFHCCFLKFLLFSFYEPAFFPVPVFSFCFYASRSQALSCFCTASFRFRDGVFRIFRVPKSTSTVYHMWPCCCQCWCTLCSIQVTVSVEAEELKDFF